MNDSNRATGKTTRMLNKVVAELISQDHKERAIKVVAYKVAYAEDLCRKVQDVLRVYGCDSIFRFTKTRIVGDYCDVEFLGQESDNLEMYKRLRAYKVIDDHFTGNY